MFRIMSGELLLTGLVVASFVSLLFFAWTPGQILWPVRKFIFELILFKLPHRETPQEWEDLVQGFVDWRVKVLQCDTCFCFWTSVVVSLIYMDFTIIAYSYFFNQIYGKLL